MKQSPDSSDEYKWPVTANVIISEKNCCPIMYITYKITYKYMTSSRSILRSLRHSPPKQMQA